MLVATESAANLSPVTTDPSSDYDRGYAIAREQLLGELVYHAEQYLTDHGNGSAWTRKFLYRFIDRLERNWDAAAERHQMRDGLGI